MVITAPLAVIKVGAVVIGKMKNIRVNENVQRGRVQGLGKLVPDELPALSWSGTLTCEFYNIDFNKSQVPNAINRIAGDIEDFENNVTLQEIGVTVDIFKKVKTNTPDPATGKMFKLEPYAQIDGLFIDTESFDITEGQVSGRNQNFQYLNPITFKK